MFSPCLSPTNSLYFSLALNHSLPKGGKWAILLNLIVEYHPHSFWNICTVCTVTACTTGFQISLWTGISLVPWRLVFWREGLLEQSQGNGLQELHISSSGAPQPWTRRADWIGSVLRQVVPLHSASIAATADANIVSLRWSWLASHPHCPL